MSFTQQKVDCGPCWNSSYLCLGTMSSGAQLVASLTAIPHGAAGGSGTEEEGVSPSCIVTQWQGKDHGLLRQMPLPILAGTHQLFGSPCRGICSLHQPIGTVRSLGRAYVQGPVPFHPHQLVWCGLAMALVW